MGKKQSTQKAHRLTYALNSDGRLVHIDEVVNGQECHCICPACKEPLVAKNGGGVRIHHFAHQSGTDCAHAYETMLHLLAKERVQQAFLSAESFPLAFEYKSYCPKKNECHYVKYGNCYTAEPRHINLKEYYDQCEQEVPYDGIHRRSDLKLYSSTHPDRAPIYIEFCVTHPSEPAKLHSGKRIIECLIEDEADIDLISTIGFVEPTQNGDKDDARTVKMHLYGFKNQDQNNNHVNCEIGFFRYVLFQSGKTCCYEDTCQCKALRKSSPYALYEVCFHTPVGFNLYEYAKYLGYDKFHIPNCTVCQNYVDSYTGMNKICKLYKVLKLSLTEKFDTSRAKDCRYFRFNQAEHDQKMKEGIDCPVEELTNTL